MYREEAITLMTETVNAYNRRMASGAGVTQEQIDSVIEQQQPQLNTVNGMLYDVLKSNGVIL